MIFTFRSALLLVLLVSLAGATQADYRDLVFCGELTESDCALLEQASENSAGQTAGSYNLDMDLDLQDFETGPSGVTGDYSFSLDVDTVWNGDLSGFETMGLEAMNMMTDPEAMLVMFAELLSEFGGSATMTLVAPQGLPSVPEDEFPAALMDGVTMEVRFVDGLVYLDLSSLATIMAAEDGVPSGWFGFHMMDLLDTMLESGMMDMDMNGAGSKSADSGKADDGDMAQDMAAMEEMLADWSDPEFLGTFMAVERLEDQILDGKGVAVFHTSIDLSALFGSAEFHEMLNAGAVPGGEAVDEDELGMMGMMGTMLGMVADAIDVESTQYIGLENRLTLREDTSMSWDMAAMMNLTGESSDAATFIAIDARVDYGYPEEDPVISVPESAFIISPGMLLAGADA